MARKAGKLLAAGVAGILLVLGMVTGAASGMARAGLGATASVAAQDASQAALSRQGELYRLPPEKLKQAQVLGRVRPALGIGSELWGIAALGLLLATGGAAKLGRWAERRTRASWLQAGLFAAVLEGGLFLVVDLPFAAMGHAVSRAYGISVEGWAAWLADEGKMLGLTVAVATPLLMGVYGLMRWRWSRRGFWAWAALMTVPVMVAGAFLLPPLIEPLFYDFEPLAKTHPALAADLEKVVKQTGTQIPADHIFLMKASEKTNDLNAYVSGFGASKRIVVWDTAANQMPEDEILFTFAHEAGHYVLLHIPKGLGLAAVGVFLLFGLTAALARWMVGRFGGRWTVAEVASLPGLVVLLLAFSMIQFASDPVQAGISRYFEHEADVYGLEAMHGVVADPSGTAVRTFQRLGEASLDDPEPNAFVVFWSYSHPSIQQRARFAAGYDPWRSGGKPRFF